MQSKYARRKQRSRRQEKAPALSRGLSRLERRGVLLAHGDSSAGVHAVDAVEVDDHGRALLLLVGVLLLRGHFVVDLLASRFGVVDAGGALEGQHGAGFRVGVAVDDTDLAGAAVVLERLEQAALGVAGPQSHLVGAVYVDAAAEGQVRLAAAVDIRNDREVAATERIAQGGFDFVRELHLGQWCWWLRRSHLGFSSSKWDSPTVEIIKRKGSHTTSKT